MDIGGNDHAPASDFLAYYIGEEIFALSDIPHFLRNYALACIENLRANRIIQPGCDPLVAVHDPIIGRIMNRNSPRFAPAGTNQALPSSLTGIKQRF